MRAESAIVGAEAMGLRVIRFARDILSIQNASRLGLKCRLRDGMLHRRWLASMPLAVHNLLQFVARL